jgi:hypothetical protein
MATRRRFLAVADEAVMAIVTTTYRYKRPPRRKHAVALEVPEVVKAATKRGRWQTPPPEPAGPLPPANDDGKPAPPPAAERKSAVVTVRRRSRFGVAEDLANATAAPAPIWLTR